MKLKRLKGLTPKSQANWLQAMLLNSRSEDRQQREAKFNEKKPQIRRFNIKT
jgi:hypothetical protein